MSKKTLGDEVRDENEHQRWLIENGKLYDAAIQRAERAEAERNELERAIMRLPQPPREMGDGPDERVTNALNEIEWQISLKLSSNDTRNAALKELDDMRIERDAARAEMERLRAAQSNFLAALDYWIDELYQHGVEIVNVPSRSTMLKARAALDEKEQTK